MATRGKSSAARHGAVRQRMPLEDRAKIFSPFDPLTGFREALRDKEREVEEEVARGMSVSHAPRPRAGR